MDLTGGLDAAADKRGILCTGSEVRNNLFGLFASQLGSLNIHCLSARRPDLQFASIPEMPPHEYLLNQHARERAQ